MNAVKKNVLKIPFTVLIRETYKLLTMLPVLPLIIIFTSFCLADDFLNTTFLIFHKDMNVYRLIQIKRLSVFNSFVF